MATTRSKTHNTKSKPSKSSSKMSKAKTVKAMKTKSMKGKKAKTVNYKNVKTAQANVKAIKKVAMVDNFYFRRYQHSMDDIIFFQFRLLGYTQTLYNDY